MSSAIAVGHTRQEFIRYEVKSLGNGHMYAVFRDSEAREAAQRAGHFADRPIINFMSTGEAVRLTDEPLVK